MEEEEHVVAVKMASDVKCSEHVGVGADWRSSPSFWSSSFGALHIHCQLDVR